MNGENIKNKLESKGVDIKELTRILNVEEADLDELLTTECKNNTEVVNNFEAGSNPALIDSNNNNSNAGGYKSNNNKIILKFLEMLEEKDKQLAKKDALIEKLINKH